MARRRNRSAKLRRKTRRKGFGRFLFRVITFLLIVTAGALALTLFFKVESVEVQGQTRYNADELRQTLGVTQGDNLFFCGKFAGIDRLRTQYPYLDTVTVRRRMPDTIVLTVNDCIPVAAISDATNGKWLIDRHGKLLENVDAETAAKYPSVVGATVSAHTAGTVLTEKDGDNIQMLLLLLDTLTESERIGRVNYMNISKLYDVHLVYDGRFDVKLGSLDGLDRKLRFLDTLVDDKLSPSDVCVIDLSVQGAASTIPSSKEAILAAGIEGQAAVQDQTVDNTLEPTS